MSSVRKKKDNIHIRIEPEQKKLISEAATLLGLDLSSFILQNTLKIAREELAAFKKITLSAQDSDVFLDALINPPVPNENLKAAYQTHQERFDSEI